MRLLYYNKLTLFDHAIGQVLKTLQERGFTENTRTIYPSERGEMPAITDGSQGWIFKYIELKRGLYRLDER